MEFRLKVALVLICAIYLSACSPGGTGTESATEPAVSSTQGSAAHKQFADISGPSNPFAESSGARPLNADSKNSGQDRKDSDTPSQAHSETMAAQTPPTREEAPVTVSASSVGIVLEPKEYNYESMQVTLSGPNGLQVKKSFKAGEATQIDHSLPDGLYKWRTVTRPSVPQWVEDKMRAVRESGDTSAERTLLAELRSQGVLPTEEQADNNVHSGTIRIHNGVMVTPGSNETRQDTAG